MTFMDILGVMSRTLVPWPHRPDVLRHAIHDGLDVGRRSHIVSERLCGNSISNGNSDSNSNSNSNSKNNSMTFHTGYHTPTYHT